jgi:TolB-like protein
VRWLFVIARQSSFIYKVRVADMQQIGRELGVRYVVEGSVRKSGTRVRPHLGRPLRRRPERHLRPAGRDH